ncbi:MAG: LuxR C-terminal-related transcriptional regulator [Nocardioides marinisabuli]|uniref:helix-turn-helix transcriptional regulator n=1 Tax=Nocardioides marinisabuli TaxID=419476 RepID=UPI00321C0941
MALAPTPPTAAGGALTTAGRLQQVGVLLRTGRVRDAAGVLAVLAAAPPTATGERATLLAVRVEVLLGRGDLTTAATLVGPLLDLVTVPGPSGQAAAAVAHHALGDLAAAAGDLDSSVEHLTRAGALAPDADPEQLPWRASQARAHLRVGRAAGSAYAVAQGLRALATVSTTGEGRLLLEEARETLAGGPAARLSAQVDTDLAGLLVLSGEGSSPRVVRLLRAAETYAADQGLWPLRQRARRLLDLVGVSAEGRSEALAALTLAERRVAELAVQGLSNREIATALVVTVKAVEWHLSRVYRKVQITSRRELAGALMG